MQGRACICKIYVTSICRFAPNGFRSFCFIQIPDQVGDDFHYSYVIAVLSGCFYGISGAMISVSWSFSSRKPSWPNFDVIS